MVFSQRGVAGDSCADMSRARVTLAVLVLGMIVLISPAQALLCDGYNDAVDGSYWEEVANCSACADASGCGYCLSTLQCMAGDSRGPSDGAPCSDWIIDSSICPGASCAK